MNFMLILIFDKIYETISELLTGFENHRNSIDYERNYIMKRFMFSFMSLIGPLFLISFFNSLMGIPCANSDCFIHSTYHFGCIFIL